MENRINEEKLFLIEAIAISKTLFLDKQDENVKTLKSASEVLSGMIIENDEELLDNMATMKQAFRDGMRWSMTHPVGVPKSYKVPYDRDHLDQWFQVFWAYVCIIAYFFYCDNILWKKCIFKNLEKEIKSKNLKADLKIAKAAIDEYYREQAELKDAILLSQYKDSQNIQAAQQSQQPAVQYVFNAPVGQVNGKVEEQHNHKV